MTIRVAINGFGRIGRNVLRAHYESGKMHDVEIVAVNTLGSDEINAHLLRYGSVYRHNLHLVSERVDEFHEAHFGVERGDELHLVDVAQMHDYRVDVGI